MDRNLMMFQRFTRGAKPDQLRYIQTDDRRQCDYDFNNVSMEKLGLNLSVTIQNYTGESVYLGASLRGNWRPIRSLKNENSRPHIDADNHVIVTILSSEQINDEKGLRRSVSTNKTQIRIPAMLLNQGSLYIEELDCYLMLESCIAATRQLIAREISDQGGDQISIPTTMVRQDPATLYLQYKQLATDCLTHQDRIQIRVGLDLQYDRIPSVLKTLHISLADSYFIPFTCNKVVYDPTLDSDTFVIQNLYVGAGSDDFVGSLAKLEEVGSIYLDPDKVDTMFGNFYRMVLFSDRKQYSDYYHARRSAERFREESLIIAERTGDPKLKEDLAKITRENTGLKSVLEEREREVRTLSTDLKTVRGTLSLREKTIEELRTHKEERLSTDVVLKDMALQNRKVDHDFQKLDVDLEEINLRRDTARSTHRASTLKATGEILKSGWGITTTCVGGLLALWALCRKYNIAITMGK